MQIQNRKHGREVTYGKKTQTTKPNPKTVPTEISHGSQKPRGKCDPMALGEGQGFLLWHNNRKSKAILGISVLQNGKKGTTAQEEGK